MRRWSWFGFSLVVLSSLLACGGPPPLDEIENNLKNPTSTMSGAEIQAAFLNYDQGQLAMRMPGLSKYGKMVSFLKVAGERKSKIVPMKDYLRRSGIPSNIAEVLLPFLPVNNDLSLRQKMVESDEFGVLRQPLPLDVKVGCVGGLGASVGLGGTSFRYSVDLGCLGEGSGKVVIRADASRKAGRAQVLFTINFEKACDKNNNCIDGGMIYKFEAEATGGNATGSMLMSMKLHASRASGESVDVKQGMRIFFDSARKAGSIDVLVYVKDKEKRERTIVLEIKAAGNIGSFSVRGANGSLTCQTTDRGKSGKCYASDNQNEVKVSW